MIEEAKRRGKRISFQYLTYDENGQPLTKRDGFRYIVSPYYSVNSNSRYYLICNYREKYRAIQSFRIDYMMNARIEEEWPIKPLESLKNCEGFNITEYLNDNIYLLAGDVIKAVVELADSNTIQYVVDWFGKNAKVTNKNGKLYAEIKCNESALFYWCMQYSECTKVISPKPLINRIKNEAQAILEKYK